MNSPQWKDGQFHNTLARNDSSIWSMLKQSFSSDAKMKTPAEPIPTQIKTMADFTSTPENGLRVTWMGHASVLIEIDGYRTLTDPVWSKRSSPVSFAGPKRFFEAPVTLEELPPLDVVLISHDHYDHLDKKTIQALKDKTELFAVPLGVGAYLKDWGIDSSRIVEKDWWEAATIGELTLTATPARHFSGRTSIYSNKTLWSGWALTTPHHRVYYSGDTAMFPGFAEIGERLGPFDLTIIEAGAYDQLWADVHLGPEQAMKAHRMVRGEVLLPVHWGTFDLANHNWTEPAERIIAAAEQWDAQIVIPQPGQSFNPATPPELVRWWPDIPWKTADEKPVISSGLNQGPEEKEMVHIPTMAVGT